MGSIVIIKSPYTVLCSAVNISQQHQETNSWECRVSNQGLLGEEQICYLCAMQSEVCFVCLCRAFPSFNLERAQLILSSLPLSLPSFPAPPHSVLSLQTPLSFLIISTFLVFCQSLLSLRFSLSLSLSVKI